MPRYEPRAWQIKAMARWIEHGHRGIISVVTGGGKTIFALSCIAELRPDTTLIVVPTAALLEQWWDEAASYFDIPLDAIHVITGNRHSAEWRSCLRGLDIQMITVTVYRRKDGTIAHEIDGSLTVAKENLGFFRYSASDRSIRIPSTVPLELEGQIRVEDPYGAIGEWIASRSEDGLWLTKLAGDPGFPHNEMLQLLRTSSGILTSHSPRS